MSDTSLNQGVLLPVAFAMISGLLSAAGLRAPSMRLQSVIAGGTESRSHVRFKTDLAETLVVEMQRLGVATAAQVGIETLAQRVRMRSLHVVRSSSGVRKFARGVEPPNHAFNRTREYASSIWRAPVVAGRLSWSC